MTQLTIFDATKPQTPLRATGNFAEIQAELAAAGIHLERWDTDAATDTSDAEAVLAAYAPELDRVAARDGYQSRDVISLGPDHPDRATLRQKFLDEHTHAEDEVRFFARGRGLFSLHVDGKVYELLCTQGDLIQVPAGTRHWFDMGPAPDFTAVRLFTNPEGWVAQFTGEDIASQFSRLDE